MTRQITAVTTKTHDYLLVYWLDNRKYADVYVNYKIKTPMIKQSMSKNTN